MAVGPRSDSGSKARSSRSSPWPLSRHSWRWSPMHMVSRSLRLNIRVVDGDTIALSGLRQHVRLVGCNAPETRNAGCEAEAQLGQHAKQRLQGLVDTGSLELTFIACSCPPGTEATQRCNHGRRCGVLRAEGRDVGSVLMSEGLAVPFQCGKASCPPTPRPWCR